MTWVNYKERKPEKEGLYPVVVLITYEDGGNCAPSLHPIKRVEYYTWKQKMMLEQDYFDRCVYKKCMCFLNDYGNELPSSRLLYWYELDPIPKEE